MLVNKNKNEKGIFLLSFFRSILSLVIFAIHLDGESGRCDCSWGFLRQHKLAEDNF